jgi:hypothetical protein
MLDVKTTSISRPFVVTAMSEAQLLHTVERSGRIYFWCAVPALLAGFAFAALAASAYEPTISSATVTSYSGGVPLQLRR